SLRVGVCCPPSSLFPYTTLFRSNVFHLALFAYYWLAGRLPEGFNGRGLEAFGFTLPPLRTFAPNLPPGIAQVLDQGLALEPARRDRKSTRLNSSHGSISYAVFFL